jgi:murein DD-endopeptidase MepM/ murein hydrolase activator NlpD
MKLRVPIDGFNSSRINQTLHGRSVYRPEDVPGHNVFKGYTLSGSGDALDIAGTGWKSPVYAVCDGAITRWQFDTQRLEVIYFEGVEDGKSVVAVYAHINRDESIKLGARVPKGTKLGVIRGDLSDPHLHFELWVDGASVSAPSPTTLRGKMMKLMDTSNGGAGSTDEPSPWAKEDWEWAINVAQIMDGKDPQGPVTREMLAAVLRRYDADRQNGGTP